MNDMQEDGVLSEWNQIGGLQVAAELREFIEKEALPGTGVAPEQFWAGLEAILAEFAPRNRAARESRRSAGQDRRLVRAHRGQPVDVAEYKRFLREIGYLRARAGRLHDRHRQRRPRDRDARRPAAGRAGEQRALCAECRQCALGQPLRRALRHRRLAARRRPGAARATTRRAAPRSSPAPARSSTRPRRWRAAAMRDATGYAIEDGALRSRLKDGTRPRPERRRRSSSATAATPTRRRASCCGTTACTSRSVIDRTHSHRQGPTRPASPTCVVEAALTTIHGLRGFRRRGRCRGQGRRLPQLARPDERRRSTRQLRQGRQDA